MKELMVNETKAYKSFRLLKGNRPVEQKHVSRIIESCKSYGQLIKPIDVNKNMEIIDGQHRYEAWKALKLPIYYIIHNNWSIQEAQILNVKVKKWSLEDYLNCYCKLGKEEYIKIKRLMDRYPFNMGSIIKFIGDTSANISGNTCDRFKSGNFKIEDIESTVKRIEQVVQFGQYYNGYTRTAFVKACIKMFSFDFYNHNEMINKLSQLSTRLVDCQTIKEYLVILEAIYNWKRKDKVRFL